MSASNPRLSKNSGTTKIKQHSIRLSSSTDIMIQNDPEFRNIVSISFDLRSSSTASALSGPHSSGSPALRRASTRRSWYASSVNGILCTTEIVHWG